MTVFDKFLKNTGRTVASLARELGISSSYLYEFRHGTKIPRLPTAYRIERLSEGSVPMEYWIPEIVAECDEDAVSNPPEPKG